MITRTLLPILLIIGAITIHLMFISPELAEIKAVQVETETIEEALVNAKYAESEIQKLAEEEAKISPKDRDRLSQILPQREDVDPVLLVNNISNIAIQSGLSLKAINYTFNDEDLKKSMENTIGTIDFTFTLEASYSTFLNFLRALERSDQLYDVTVTSFSAGSSDIYVYSVTLKKYFLQ